MTVDSILRDTGQTGEDIETLVPGQTVREAVSILAARQIGVVLIVDGKSTRPIGIVSERDVLRVLGESDADALDLPVGEIMTPDPVMCDRSTRIDAALKQMTTKRCRHLPVLDGDRVVGVISSRDIMVYMVETATKQERERIVAMIALA